MDCPRIVSENIERQTLSGYAALCCNSKGRR